ncbi:hypothetical protein HMPREF9371_1959 [Neisseria shayeganii 871]|uniref:Uncharacterized protein n=1 Tax=Neisseria shayeganii 871 TaxID=1032488 RepID=G4CK19_9NEIS|nr:hypothetical protein HMPREF9371_1959 [Neisseria shayeganii 871]
MFIRPEKVIRPAAGYLKPRQPTSRICRPPRPDSALLHRQFRE